LVKNGADLTIESKDEISALDLAKKGPLGQKFANKLKEMAKGVPVMPVDISIDRVYWG